LRDFIIRTTLTLIFFEWSVIMALIKCPECGAEVSDRADECINCGCPLNEPAVGVAANPALCLPLSFCTKCGKELAGDARFCGACGSAVAAQSAENAVDTFEVIGDRIPPNHSLRTSTEIAIARNEPVYWDISDDIKKSGNTKKIVIAAVTGGLCLGLVCVGIMGYSGSSKPVSAAAPQRSAGVAKPAPAPAPRLPEPRNEQVILPTDKFESLLKEVVKISATEMNDLYNSNKIGYENRFGGKYFIITGRISQIRPAYIGSTSIVELRVPDWNDDIRVVYPENISDAEREYIGSLRNGYEFQAFVRGQTNRPGYVDIVCKSVNGQARTVTFNATAPPTTNEYGRAAAEHLTEATEQSITEAAEFLGGFLEGLLGQ
jgi:hypothetical protein